MAEPISGVQNQTIILKVGLENSHLSSIQRYAALAATMSSAQNVDKRVEREATAPKNVESSDQKRTKTATEGGSQGAYSSLPRTKDKEKAKSNQITEEDSHLLDVRV
ncbi:MAG TPA: hypothetical protein PKI14_04715 [Fervidobacterium sp.]|nr:hypothetical protein [Fervidobacterium sp.]HOQ40155.1 hypothetical protein [Fervidobacterium sp.]HPZ16874.1 hypothetical protein [Fervidobacterium sp.]HQE47871.1 hypothetical protein [Fervidobacterium sp.]HRD19430.1 hypothetical protein [Fervidobacterium sp.]